MYCVSGTSTYYSASKRSVRSNKKIRLVNLSTVYAINRQSVAEWEVVYRPCSLCDENFGFRKPTYMYTVGPTVRRLPGSQIFTGDNQIGQWLVILRIQNKTSNGSGNARRHSLGLSVKMVVIKKIVIKIYIG